MSVEFCDTKVIVYAYDLSAGAKRTQSLKLLRHLWKSGDGALSMQVLQETFVTLTRKAVPPLAPLDARAIVSDLSTWKVIEPGRQDILDAIDGALRWRVSFWDAMVLTAARKADAAVIWSEDLGDGQRYDGIVVRNPFRLGAEQ
ncbi:MAG: PIN domain-containing protein [Chloroflexota bacterium]|nr:MAG: PIN domain-containing protein [Chloroflexota bacterium]